MKPPLRRPPSTSTLPLLSNVAVWLPRATVILPVVVHLPVARLNSSAVVVQDVPIWELPLLSPPATSTSPFGSRVAVCCPRATVMLPVVVHFPLAGSYNSEPLRKPVEFTPPAANTWPFWSRVAVCLIRAVLMLPVEVQVPEAKAG